MTVQILAFAVVFAALVILSSYVRLNIGLGGTESDRVIRALLSFVGTSNVWMVFTLASYFAPDALPGSILRFIALCSMITAPVTFLCFALKLAEVKPVAPPIVAALIANGGLLVARYLFPFNIGALAFWRLRHPVLSPLAAIWFCLPIAAGTALLVRSGARGQSPRRKSQLRMIALGAGIATACVFLSEYVFPTLLGVDFGLLLMYAALLIFVALTCHATRKLGLMVTRPDYVFRSIFKHAPKAAIVVGSDGCIVSANNEAKRILDAESLSPGAQMEDYISDYRCDVVYNCREITVGTGDGKRYLLLSQFPIDARHHDSEKVIILTDITDMKLRLMHENTMLLNKTYVDRLTGLYNRYYITDPESPFYSSGDQPDTIALLFIDADNFKAQNDTYGHLAGDDILCELADCIRESIPDGACAVRYGGDEFIVVLSGDHAYDAQEVAERIRNRASELDLSHIGADAKLSLSIGLVCGSPPLVELIDRADRAMYTSKRRGKNTVTAEQGDIA